MATQASLDLVQTLYVAYYGRPADAAGQTYWADRADSEGAAAIINAFGTSAEYEARFGELSNEELVNNLYQQLFGRDAEQAGVDYYVDQLESGNSTLAEIALEIRNGAQNEDAETVDAKLQAAQEFTDLAGDGYAGDDAADVASEFLAGVDSETNLEELDVEGAVDGLPEPQEPTEPSVPGESFELSDGRDTLSGTENDDTFMGLVGQNHEGAVANEFSTGDYIDGGAGRDSVVATLINDSVVDDGQAMDVAPWTDNVEEIHIEALGAGDEIVVDSGRLNSVEEYWSDNSSADLTFTDVRLGNLGITKDVTFGLREVDYDTDFTAEFDSQSLVREASNQVNSQLAVRIADISTETPETPLANVNLNLSFNLGEETVDLENIQSTDGTYPGLVEAIDAALEEAGYGDLNVELSTPYSEVTFADNTVTLPDFVAQEILVTDPNGGEFSDVNFTQSNINPVDGGFLVAGNAEPVDPSSVSNLIESNLVLDDAGRGSTAGDVVIGGMSNSDLGVEQFNVFVDRDSQIASLETTNDALQEIHISSLENAGDLYIGNTQDDLVEIDANAFEGGSLSIGEGDSDSGNDTAAPSVSNLAFLDAGNTAADVTFVGDNDDGLAASLQTGSGNDSISLDQAGVSASGSTPTSATIDVSGGDNVVSLTSSNADAIDNTATVTALGGDDVVRGGANSLTASTGGGDDAIYAENTGTFTETQLDAGVWSNTAGTTTSGTSTFDNAQLLYGREVQVTLGLPGAAPNAVESFVDGLEATAEIQASNGYLTTERDLYEAVAKAINEDATLSKLATASVDSNGHLSVDYLIDGVSDAATPEQLVQVEVLGDWADLSSSDQTNIVSDLQEEYTDSDIAAGDVEGAYDANNVVVQDVDVVTAGANSAANGGTNSVNAGAGDDVVVLSSDAATVDTVVFEEGQFGSDTIVHFNDAAGGDVLDFTDWLDNQYSSSGSPVSEDRAATTLAADAASFTENSVVVTDFATLDGASGTALDFANMSNAEVLSALNADASFASLAGDGQLVGSEQKSIMLIENAADNAGEYKVYEVTSDAAAGNDNFTSAELVGTADFGATQAFVGDNVA